MCMFHTFSEFRLLKIIFYHVEQPLSLQVFACKTGEFYFRGYSTKVKVTVKHIIFTLDFSI